MREKLLLGPRQIKTPTRREKRGNRERENKMAKGVYYNSATVFVNQRLCQSARGIKNAG